MISFLFTLRNFNVKSTTTTTTRRERDNNKKRPQRFLHANRRREREGENTLLSIPTYGTYHIIDLMIALTMVYQQKRRQQRRKKYEKKVLISVLFSTILVLLFTTIAWTENISIEVRLAQAFSTPTQKKYSSSARLTRRHQCRQQQRHYNQPRKLHLLDPCNPHVLQTSMTTTFRPHTSLTTTKKTPTTTTKLFLFGGGLFGGGVGGGNPLMSRPMAFGFVVFLVVRSIFDAIIGGTVSLKITTKLEELDSNSNNSSSSMSLNNNAGKALEVVSTDGKDTPTSISSSSLYRQYIDCIQSRTPFSPTLVKVLDDEIFSKSWTARRVRKRFVAKGLIQ